MTTFYALNAAKDILTAVEAEDTTSAKAKVEETLTKTEPEALKDWVETGRSLTTEINGTTGKLQPKTGPKTRKVAGKKNGKAAQKKDNKPTEAKPPKPPTRMDVFKKTMFSGTKGTKEEIIKKVLSKYGGSERQANISIDRYIRILSAFGTLVKEGSGKEATYCYKKS